MFKQTCSAQSAYVHSTSSRWLCVFFAMLLLKNPGLLTGFARKHMVPSLTVKNVSPPPTMGSLRKRGGPTFRALTRRHLSRKRSSRPQ